MPKSVFQMVHPGLLLDLLYFVHKSTFGYYGFLDHFMLAWVVLFVVPLYMGMALRKGTRKYIGMYFRCSA